MTGEDRVVTPVELVVALERAVMVGLRAFPPGEDTPMFEVLCFCGAALYLPATPWHPTHAAGLLDAFARRHVDHDRATEEDR
jgi:hypothetical protein